MNNITGKKERFGERLFIVAEASQAFEGNRVLVEKLIQAAHYAGADAIKFQIFTADELAVPSHNYFSLYQSLELPLDFWESQIDACHRAGMKFFADVFGTDTASELHKRGADGFKVHSADALNMQLLDVLRELGRPVMLSSAGVLPEEVEKALDRLGRDASVVIMHGFQAEPTELRDTHLNRLIFLSQRFGRPVGLSDHISGDRVMAKYLPLIALGMGIRVFEKHITLSREVKGEDYFSALNPDEFKEMVECLKDSMESFGPREFEMPEAELVYRKASKKQVVAAKNIKAGDSLTLENITLRRSNQASSIFSLEEVMGKKAKVAINKFDTITLEALE